MNKTGYLGITLLFLAAAAQSLAAQDGPQAKSKAEYDAYSALYNETDLATKASLGEAFLEEFPDSEFLPATYQLLVNAYAGTSDWPSVIETADRFTSTGPDADDVARRYIYQNTMAAAQMLRNIDKIREYGNRLLEVDPNNLGAMLTLSSMIVENLPEDAGARARSLQQAFDLANRARVQAQQFFGSGEGESAQRAQVNSTIHTNLGFVHMERGDYARASQEYVNVIGFSPRDGNAYFRLGLCYEHLAAQSSREVVDAIEAQNEAIQQGADATSLEQLTARQEALQRNVLVYMDRAIDSFATATAIGGVIGTTARARLEAIYRTKNEDSTEGLEDLIDEKRAQLSER